ncbi:DENN domain-containing protein 1B-like isoform X1 [Microplitis mediator]|uniref:DENN domain-containing protein 1B-like isoform X1 n=1 Tax=Microplitis mediator TaxID=375433 RepID=UPI002557884F|nr:DENN domain-containing protein 1B-like isoform X1 [Microplitis mediator]
MGSRLRQNVKHLFECFCEVAAPVGEKSPWILQKYPESFADNEILKSVPKFSYPCDFEKTTVQHFSFVLTSIDSKWTFGFCRHDPKTETALVILSSLPWHEMFYKLLNLIATLTTSSNSGDLWKFLGDVYASNVPMPGTSVTIPLPDPNITYTCQSPRQFELPSIPENRNLTEYYSAVDSHNMIVIFASMLYERRIIFTSKRLSRLSACVQACNALIYPMIWQHIYIPVLPVALIDYLLAPMPFLIGVPTPILERVQKNDLGDVVVLDADNNKIESPFQDLESLPQDVINNLRKALRNRPALLGDGVSRAFLRALVQLTAGYREALTLQQGERITFDQNAFVESRPYSMQPFLRKMLELQIFQQFIEERLHMLNSGLGFSDEFEMEACNYSDKSSSKIIQQYREWTTTMKKEGSAFFRSVKDKANPAVKYAVKSVKDKGKNMKTVYKGLKWKNHSRGNENSIRFHQPRSAPSSPTSDRKLNIFGSGFKSPSGFTATTSYRKELRLRNSNIPDTSRKQYSPLNPSSPEESDSLPERLNIDLMNELQDVIFPNTPAVDRTLKPVRSLDSLRPAWSGRLRHGSPPSVPSNDTLPNQNYQSAPLSFKSSNNIVSNVKQTKDSHDNQITKIKIINPPVLFTQKKIEKIVGNNSDKKNNQLINLTDPFVNVDEKLRPSKELNSNNPFANDVNEKQCDPFDTSPMQTALSGSFSDPITHNPLRKNYSSLNKELSSCSAHSKESVGVPDLIRLDSTNSDDDFDPLLSKSFVTTNQMSQSLHIPQSSEGLSNPLYPYFLPRHNNTDSKGVEKNSNDEIGDLDLLQEYGLDFHKFNLTNGASSTRITGTTSNIDNVFGSSFSTTTAKSQNHWTKFE